MPETSTTPSFGDTKTRSSVDRVKTKSIKSHEQLKFHFRRVKLHDNHDPSLNPIFDINLSLVFIDN